MDAFGKDWFDLRDVEASVFKPDGNGAPILLCACGPTSGGSWREAAIEVGREFRRLERKRPLLAWRARVPDTQTSRKRIGRAHVVAATLQ
jgi:hypothetical protein